MTTIGSVAELWRFPVKSMGGAPLDAVTVTGRGVLGDRAYAVVDRSDGKVASAKHPRKWGGLLACRADFVDEPVEGEPAPPVTITFPDGSSARSDDPGASSALSGYLGRDVALADTAPAGRAIEEVWPDVEGLAPADFVAATTTSREPGGEPVSDIALGLASPPETFFDLSVIHLLTTSTLGELASRAPEGSWDVRRYRPNVLVRTDETGFVENGWVGRELAVGGAAVAVTMATMRCVMTTLEQPGLPRDRSTLQTIAATNRVEIHGLGHWACAGVYADVSSGGVVRVGDAVA